MAEKLTPIWPSYYSTVVAGLSPNYTGPIATDNANHQIRFVTNIEVGNKLILICAEYDVTHDSPPQECYDKFRNTVLKEIESYESKRIT